MPQKIVSRNENNNPILLTFTNNCAETVDILWLDFDGKGVKYSSIGPGKVYVQETYTNHAWRIQTQSGNIVFSTLFEDTAPVHTTITVQPNLAAVVTTTTHPTLSLNTTTFFDPKWGHWRIRGLALNSSFPIYAFDCVCEEAVQLAIMHIDGMLNNCNLTVLDNFKRYKAAVGIIGREQVTTDLPPHRHLKGATCRGGNDDLDGTTKGLGGSVTCPFATVGEENLLMTPGDKYFQESILIHELAHSVMNIGLYNHPLYNDIESAYRNSISRGLYPRNAYIACNADEYWAESCQIYFEATVRRDDGATGGICTRRELMKRDPVLLDVLITVYGSEDWRYISTAPRWF